MTTEGTLPTIRSVRAGTAWLALVAVAAAAWWFLLVSERVMTTMQGEGPIADLMWMMMRPGSVLPYLGAALVMWVVMMVAMMTPAVMPMAAVYRGLYKGPRRNLATFVFANGYLAAWAVFSIAAAGLQWLLHAQGVLHGMSLAASARVAGGLLVFAGLYQLTPLKEACLAHCRSPLGYFMNRWRDGLGGAFSMGFRHGAFCIGCCWVLMLLMFAGGAMSVMTMAVLAVFILAERLIPAGPWAARAPGVGMILLGAVVAAGG
ncbi:MAG: DUF2182 domain-containing protein [Gammaproteobacteria bacterium]|nr:DUF2182 domain-containing protein [Gammaproteobacteria bacterium]MCP5199664.1 DUF2182 domain-containing protein [Gammaproteobacteria bacterium]